MTETFNLSIQSVEEFHKFYFRFWNFYEKNLDDLDEKKTRILQQLLFLQQCHIFWKR